MICYDREGHEIPYERWVILFEDTDYRRVAEDEIGPYWISTVWLGLDHSFGHAEAPWIYETMVFKGGDMAGVEQRRYATLEQAQVGHEETVSEVRLFATL